MNKLEWELIGATFDALETGVIILDSSQRVVAWNDWLSVQPHSV
jgi:hypothetical protein